MNGKKAKKLRKAAVALRIIIPGANVKEEYKKLKAISKIVKK